MTRIFLTMKESPKVDGLRTSTNQPGMRRKVVQSLCCELIEGNCFSNLKEKMHVISPLRQKKVKIADLFIARPVNAFNLFQVNTTARVGE